MTVCIAAICNIGRDRAPMVVAVADRMITIDGIGYEPNQTKMVDLAAKTLGLLAGDMQLHAAVVPRVLEQLNRNVADRDDKRVTVEEIAMLYAEQFAIYLRQRAEREILFKRNLSFDKFYVKKHDMPHYQAEKIDNDLLTFRIEASGIIAGIDHTGGHIYRIDSPGVAECMDVPFFACIGSGAALASVPFMLARYDKTWLFERSLLLAFSAKTRAEKTTNVGDMTDIAFIQPSGIVHLVEEEKAKLREILKKQVNKEVEAENAAYNELEEYIRSKVQEPLTANLPDQTTVGVVSAEAVVHPLPAKKVAVRNRKKQPER